MLVYIALNTLKKSTISTFLFFFFKCSAPPRHLPPSPTRPSSDLPLTPKGQKPARQWGGHALVPPPHRPHPSRPRPPPFRHRRLSDLPRRAVLHAGSSIQPLVL